MLVSFRVWIPPSKNAPFSAQEKSLVSSNQYEECLVEQLKGTVKGRIRVGELEGTFGNPPGHPVIFVCFHSGKTRAAFISMGRRGGSGGRAEMFVLLKKECPS